MEFWTKVNRRGEKQEEIHLKLLTGENIISRAEDDTPPINRAINNVVNKNRQTRSLKTLIAVDKAQERHWDGDRAV